MSKRTPYENLPFLPVLIADVVCSQEYTGSEWSKNVVNPREVKMIEGKRQKMTPEKRAEFAKACDARCKAAYNLGAQWFLNVVKAKDNAGRDMLYNWIAHWMTGYLTDKKTFMRNAKNAAKYHC